MSYRDPKYDWEEGFVTFREYLQMSRDIGFRIIPELKHGAATTNVTE